MGLSQLSQDCGGSRMPNNQEFVSCFVGSIEDFCTGK